MSRAALVLATTLASLGVIYPLLARATTRLVWNASASVPIGLYRVDPDKLFNRADLVVIDTPEPLARFLAERGYLPEGVLLLKRILGVAGQTVCRSGLTITVDGVAMGAALGRDDRGRDLPVWRGCRRIRDGEVFLMNRLVRDSLDGRYFGTIPTARILGRAVPLFIDETGTGRFRWQTPP